MTYHIRPLRLAILLILLGGMTFNHTGHAQEEEVANQASKALPIAKIYEDKWKEHRTEKVQFDVRAPGNATYSIAVIPKGSSSRDYNMERRLNTVFRGTTYENLNLGGIEVDKDGVITAAGKTYTIYFRRGDSNLTVQTMEQMRKQFYAEFQKATKSPRLEDMTLIKGQYKVYFGVLLDGKAMPAETDEDKKAESELLDMIQEVTAGHKVKEFVIEKGNLTINKKVITLQWFYPLIDAKSGKATGSDFFNAENTSILQRKFYRQIHYVYDVRPKEIAATPNDVKEFKRPTLRVDERTTYTERKSDPDETAKSFSSKMAHFQKIMDVIENTSPPLFKRLEEELGRKRDLRVHMSREPNFKKLGRNYHFSHFIRHTGFKIEIAEPKWDTLDKNNRIQENRSISFFYALLYGVLPQSDTDRGGKAHDLTMEIYQNIRDFGLTNNSFSDLSSAKQTELKSEIGKLVDAFVVSSTTRKIRGYIPVLERMKKDQADNLSKLGAAGKPYEEVMELLVELAKSDAEASLQHDYRVAIDQSVDSPFSGTVNLALWRLFQDMDKNPRWAKSIDDRKKLIQEALNLILKGEFKSVEDMKKAAELLKESKKPKPAVSAPPTEPERRVEEKSEQTNEGRSTGEQRGSSKLPIPVEGGQ